MQIVDFTAAHVEQAARIAKINYDEERGHVPVLPPVDSVPDLTEYAENGLGVAALEGGEMLGFLCCKNPWDNAWHIPGLRHVFSPMGANGTISLGRAKIYARLYETAGAKWVKAGAGSHGICLYAHDTAGQAQFFRYGFGMRCIDAIRGLDGVADTECDGYTFNELTPDEAIVTMPLDNRLHGYLLDSPFFLYRAEHNETDYKEYLNMNKPTCFAAEFEGRTVAYFFAEREGETFIMDTPGYYHISAAYCLPEHRGKGLSQRLLYLLTQKLKSQGYNRLGVDYESVNPSGSAFWGKHFDAYTHSVVRRIDELALQEP